MKQWIEKEFNNHVYFDDKDGKIIGLVSKHGNWQTIYLAKIFNVNDGILGQYIDIDYGKRAVEEYWDIQERTLIA